MGFKLLNSSGFTLTELMTTVAIVGLLTAIAVPTYNHQVNISHQKEAKANLLALDASEKSFWSEYAQASGRFDEIGFKPSGTLTYKVGFTGDHAGPTNALSYNAADNDCFETVAHATTCRGGFAQWTNGLTATSAGAFGSAPSSVPGPSWNPGVSWIAYARANNSAANDDEWTIDSSDNLINSSPGI